MNSRWLWAGTGCVLLALLASAGAPAPRAGASVGASARRDSAQSLATKIDQLIEAHWKADNVRLAPLADDAEFARRLYLDLIGRTPSVAEIRDFLDDKSADKRHKLVERLLDSPGYVNHFINVWRSVLMPEADASFEVRLLLPTFESWLRQKLTDNVGYDQMVREIVTVAFGGDRQVVFDPRGPRDATPVAFYIGKEAKPENLAASTARMFLGLRLECAQCHDHPTAKWKQDQFWSYAAFFAGLQRESNENVFSPIREVLDRREMAVPGKDIVVQATFLDGSDPLWKPKTAPRMTLADWITSAENPYFARAAANRLWAHFFGIGLVEPVDDLDETNPPSHPELLDLLARQFTEHRFDVKFLIRAITTSRAYQLTSAVTDSSQEDPRRFARMAVKGLTPEQIFDSVATATGYRDPTPRLRPFLDLENRGPREEFLAKFSNQNDKRTEYQTSILQALALMNGKLIAEATSIENSETLAAVADAPFLSTEQRIETLFLATLSRRPRSEETARLVKYVDGGGASGDSKKALADVFWALLNSGEFFLNH